MIKTDIIIPIYNALDFTKKCIETVIRHTDLTTHHLLLINDKSPDSKILPMLQGFIDKFPHLNITLINNKENMGFVKTVNIGMTYSEHDVILLNSDTEVTESWLQKMQACAYSKPAVATVTPLSNNATLASVPFFLKENSLPKHLSVDKYAALIEKFSLHIYPEIPTAHGFCMYIKRETIQTVGLFDEQTFGKGYGEENDFSYRCLEYGYRHLLCDDTFVYHKGTQSFSTEKEKLIQKHLQILQKKHPTCVAQTNRFVKENPISEIQQNVLYTVDLYERKNILIVIHDFSAVKKGNFGGTTLHVHDLIEGLNQDINFHVLHYSKEKDRHCVESYFPSGHCTMPLSKKKQYTTLNTYNDLFAEEIAELLIALKIDLIHIHHLMDMYLDIFTVAEKRNIPVIYSIHDYYCVCPSYKLYDEKQFICSYLDLAHCAQCIQKRMKQNINFMPLWRKIYAENLHKACQIIAPSHSAKEIIEKAYPNLNIKVIEHGYELPIAQKYKNTSEIQTHANSKQFHIAFIGGISKEKGFDFLLQLIQEAKGSNVVIHLFGYTSSRGHKFHSNYIDHGPYLRDELPSLLQKNNIRLICLFSVWAETFSYTLSESMANGIPVIAFDLGSIGERIKKADTGWLFPPSTSAHEIFKHISRLQTDLSAEYKQKTDNIIRYQQSMKSVKEMAEEYKDIYIQAIQTHIPTNLSKEATIQARRQFYQRVQNLSWEKRENMGKAEYHRIKRLIKGGTTTKQAFEEITKFRETYPHSKYHHKLLFKFFIYKILLFFR